MIDHHCPKNYTDHRYSTLDNICSFVNEQLSKSKAIRFINRRTDGVKINKYRERLNYALREFDEVCPSELSKDMLSQYFARFNLI